MTTAKEIIEQLCLTCEKFVARVLSLEGSFEGHENSETQKNVSEARELIQKARDVAGKSIPRPKTTSKPRTSKPVAKKKIVKKIIKKKVAKKKPIKKSRSSKVKR